MQSIDELLSKLPQNIATDIVNLLAEKDGIISHQNTLLKKNEESLQDKDNQINSLEYKITLLMRERYCSRSDKIPLNPLKDPQGSLFDEIEVLSADKQQAISQREQEISVASYQRAKGGRKPLPKDISRIEQIYDIEEQDKYCNDCGNPLEVMGDERSNQLDIIPLIMQVIENIRLKYCCRHCQGNIKIAALPKQIIPKSIATPGLLAHVLVSKFCDHLPFYRQEKILERVGVDIGRGTLCRWAMMCAQQLIPLIELMQEIIVNYDVTYADETPVQVLKEPNKRAEQLSTMWLYIGGKAENRCYIYEYQPSRAGLHAENFLEGFKGYLHIDGYKGYERLFKLGVNGVGCLSHVRRKFVKIVQCREAQYGLAQMAVNQIAKLYAIESEIKKSQLTLEEIKQIRQEKSKPLLEKFKLWLDKHQGEVLPQSPLGKAINYAINQWPLLIRYIEDGRLEIDNNRTERSIKPFAIGRNNWLFHDNVEGAKAGAVIFSLIETCKAHGLNVYYYMKYILTEIVNCETVEQLEKLLPFNCAKEVEELQNLANQRPVKNELQIQLAANAS